VPIQIDRNVILDLMTENPAWFGWSAATLAPIPGAVRHGINRLIDAEVSVPCSPIEDLEEALWRTMFDREAILFEAALPARKSFLACRRRRGISGLRCQISLSAPVRLSWAIIN